MFTTEDGKIEDDNKTILFSMSNTKELSERIASKLNLPIYEAHKTVFADGEILMASPTRVRNSDVYIVASATNPINDSLMELFLFIDALKRASAKTINLVMTYYGYARQDRKTKGRQSIGAKLMADFITVSGVSKLMTVDLHNSSIQGFFGIPVDDLRGQFILADALKKNDAKFTIVSPDHGGAVRARLLSELISDDIQIAIVDKRRTGPNKSEIKNILGDVKNKNVVIIDDIIDTGGTIIHAADGLKKAGAKKIFVAATHGLFTKGFDLFQNSESIDKVLVTDSIPTVKNIKENKRMTKLQIVSLDEFIANVIKVNINKKSVTSVYNAIREKMFNG